MTAPTQTTMCDTAAARAPLAESRRLRANYAQSMHDLETALDKIDLALKKTESVNMSVLWSVK